MRIILFLFLVCSFSCATKVSKVVPIEQRVIDESIKTHGGELYQTAQYQFDFREKHYSFKHQDARYAYTFDHTKNDRSVHSFLDNDQFIKTINGDTLNLSAADQVRYGNSLNSVIYFALLPYRLNDPAVIKAYKGITKIKEQPYHIIEVRFSEEKGGSDHEDIYYYWINEKTNTMDYLAYNFHVNGGGVRFRSAFNPRIIDGIRFQDYENYSAPVGTNLADLPQLYENNKLKLLSKIELENVRVMN